MKFVFGIILTMFAVSAFAQCELEFYSSNEIIETIQKFGGIKSSNYEEFCNKVVKANAILKIDGTAKIGNDRAIAWAVIQLMDSETSVIESIQVSNLQISNFATQKKADELFLIAIKNDIESFDIDAAIEGLKKARREAKTILNTSRHTEASQVDAMAANEPPTKPPKRATAEKLSLPGTVQRIRFLAYQEGIYSAKDALCGVSQATLQKKQKNIMDFLNGLLSKELFSEFTPAFTAGYNHTIDNSPIFSNEQAKMMDSPELTCDAHFSESRVTKWLSDKGFRFEVPMVVNKK